MQQSINNTTIAYYLADIITAQDYSSFGSLLQGRQYGTTPRYTYNGKQLDVETGWQDYGMRNYLVDVPVFTSVDPLTAKYPELTPYQFASNSPISGIDLDGLEFESVYDEFHKKNLEKKKPVPAPKVQVVVINKHNDCHHSSTPPTPNYYSSSGSSFLNTWFPQILLQGSGDESFGSTADPSRPIVTVNMGSGGHGKEFFELVMLFSKIKTPEVDNDPVKKVIEDGPKTAKNITDAIKKIMDANLNNQNTNTPLTPSNTTDNNGTNTNAPINPQPSLPSNTFFVFKRADTKKFYNKTIKKGTVTKDAYFTDTTIEYIPGKTGKTGSKVDTFLIIDKTYKRN